QALKLTYPETLDRIKEEFQFLQNQYHSLKLECEKLATEKTEIQRHYVMYYEMSYGLNIEMHKQTEIAKRLNVICAQLIPFLSQEHQQQVVQAVERAKQVTMTDLNAAIGHQLQAQHLPHHAPPIPLTPHPAGLQPPGLAGLAGASGLLALSGALGAQAQLLAKDERGGHDAEHRGERGPARAATGLCPSSLVLPNGDRARAIADYLSSSKKRKVEDKDFGTDYGSDADKSEDNLVVDEVGAGAGAGVRAVSSGMAGAAGLLLPPALLTAPLGHQDPASPRSVHSYSSRENGAEKAAPGRKEAAPPSPTSLASSSSASPSRGRD
ncbi:TLE1 protein, partial [Nothoprocta pentlandii]|nr:TLE1 protein [Nothoprocta pentlandii]